MVSGSFEESDNGTIVGRQGLFRKNLTHITVLAGPNAHHLPNTVARDDQMRFVGVDYSVDLECRACGGWTPYRYSEILSSVVQDRGIDCSHCGRTTNHGWDSMRQAQALGARFMRSRQAAQTA